MSPKRSARRAKFKDIREAIQVRAEQQGMREARGHVFGRGMRTTKQVKIPRTGPNADDLHWRESVLCRDGYKCVFCGSTERLEADHIKPKSIYPELKHEISNGRTLCHPCHQRTETYGERVKRIVSVVVH